MKSYNFILFWKLCNCTNKLELMINFKCVLSLLKHVGAKFKVFFFYIYYLLVLRNQRNFFPLTSFLLDFSFLCFFSWIFLSTQTKSRKLLKSIILHKIFWQKSKWENHLALRCFFFTKTVRLKGKRSNRWDN